jgi:hypothetical protein
VEVVKIEREGMINVMAAKRKMCLNQSQFRLFAEKLKDGVRSGRYDSAPFAYGKVRDLVYGEMKRACVDWWERRGWMPAAKDSTDERLR